MGFVAPALSFAGSVQQAKAQYEEGLARQAAQEYNAQIQEHQAKQIEAAKGLELSQITKEQRRRAGKIRAQAGAGGGSLGGSPLHILNDNITEFEIEKQVIAYNADIDALRARQGAALSRFEGKQAFRQGKYASRATLLAGTSKMLTEYTEMATGTLKGGK
jgi:hypothetical protein